MCMYYGEVEGLIAISGRSNWMLSWQILELEQLWRKILARRAHSVKFSTALANKKAITVKIRNILAFLKAWPRADGRCIKY